MDTSKINSGMHMVCGLSYHKSPVNVREKIAIPAQRLPEALRFVKEQPGVKECMVLSTCNRTEIYLSAEGWLDGRDLFERFAREVCAFDLAPFAGQVHFLTGTEAIRHLFRVASSLDSLVLGEPQILGQTKSAFRAAEAEGCIDRDLHRWIPRAFAAAKQVRSETGICDAAVSVSYAAVQLAGKIFERLEGRSVVLLGAGKMGELAAQHLKEAGASPIYVLNRTLEKAREVAARCGGAAGGFDERQGRIAAADMVICSTDAGQYVLDAAMIREALRSRVRRPLLVLDISIPRNVDPSVQKMDGVYLFNVDDLENVVQANRAGRMAEAVRAESLLQKAMEKLVREEDHARLAPSIAAVRNQVHSVCMKELDRLQSRIPELSAEDRQELEMMLHRIAQKIVHPAIMEMKACDCPGDTDARPPLVERLFGVERQPRSVNPRPV